MEWKLSGNQWHRQHQHSRFTTDPSKGPPLAAGADAETVLASLATGSLMTENRQSHLLHHIPFIASYKLMSGNVIGKRREHNQTPIL
jgi:hypothetical protein